MLRPNRAAQAKRPPPRKEVVVCEVETADGLVVAVGFVDVDAVPEIDADLLSDGELWWGISESLTRADLPREGDADGEGLSSKYRPAPV